MTSLRHKPFGVLPDGRSVEQFTLENARGMRVSLLSFGGIVQSIRVPDSSGATTDVVLGFDTLEQYLADGMCVGAAIGRYANRIANARFTVDGTTYHLAANDGPNILHGGAGGFHRTLWSLDPHNANDGSGVTLHVRSPDGDQGFPGTLDVALTYALSDDDVFSVVFVATTDAPTPVSLTTHGYFNLAGHDTGTILDHELTLAASRFTPISPALVPTGELRDVTNTPFDFRLPTPIGARLAAPDEQLVLGWGYDHNFVIERDGEAMTFAARLRDPVSGRTMEIHTTEPGIQLYISGRLREIGKGGAQYAAHSGVALETQHFPDSPNEPAFPSTIVRPGKTFTARTEFRFASST